MLSHKSIIALIYNITLSLSRCQQIITILEILHYGIDLNSSIWDNP